MKISNKIAAICVAAVAAAACGKTASIKCSIPQAPDSQVIVKLLDVNSYKVLDTVMTDAAGKFNYKMKVAEGQPEFVYLFFGDTKVASLILQNGESVTVEADTLGNYKVEGSEESLKLQEVENKYSAFLKDVINIVSPLDSEQDLSDADRSDINRQLSHKYISYYREALKYVMTNPKSLTSIPVLYQTVNNDFPVFNQPTDAIHFRNVCDSLKTVYPDSKYVKALEKEAQRRNNILGINVKLRDANQSNFPDINLPDINGEKKALSSLDSKVILLHFWTASAADQKMLNVDELLPLYNEYHSRGLDIYAVAIDVDKATWAASVRNQNLPWTNVCDGLGTASSVLGTYNVAALPCTFIIANGNMTSASGGDLRKTLNSLL